MGAPPTVDLDNRSRVPDALRPLGSIAPTDNEREAAASAVAEPRSGGVDSHGNVKLAGRMLAVHYRRRAPSHVFRRIAAALRRADVPTVVEAAGPAGWRRLWAVTGSPDDHERPAVRQLVDLLPPLLGDRWWNAYTDGGRATVQPFAPPLHEGGRATPIRPRSVVAAIEELGRPAPDPEAVAQARRLLLPDSTLHLLQQPSGNDVGALWSALNSLAAHTPWDDDTTVRLLTAYPAGQHADTQPDPDAYLRWAIEDARQRVADDPPVRDSRDLTGLLERHRDALTRTHVDVQARYVLSAHHRLATEQHGRDHGASERDVQALTGLSRDVIRKRWDDLEAAGLLERLTTGTGRERSRWTLTVPTGEPATKGDGSNEVANEPPRGEAANLPPLPPSSTSRRNLPRRRFRIVPLKPELLDGYRAIGAASATLDVLTDEPAGPTNLAAIIGRSPRTVRDHLNTLLRHGLARRPSRGAYVIAPGWRNRLHGLAVEHGTAGQSAHRRRAAHIEQDDYPDALIWRTLTEHGRCDLDTLHEHTSIPRDDLRRRLGELERYGAVHHSPTLGEWIPKGQHPERTFRIYHPAGDHTDPDSSERYDVHRMPIEPGSTWVPDPRDLDDLAERAAEQLRLPGLDPDST